MKVSELCEKLSLECAAGNDGLSKEIKGCYIGDLLSLAMASVKEGTLWITIQTNINVAAVASLGDAACVIIADGFKPDENMCEKAQEEGIPIITTDLSAHEIASELSGCGI